MNVMQSFSLAGKRGLITGATRGIGQYLAIALAQAGADIVITGRQADTVAATQASLRQAFPDIVVEGVTLDVRDVSAVQQSIACLGPLDILVNNAGMEQVCPSLDIDERLWNAITDTNLRGAFFCAQAAARSMVAQKSGVIINLCSLTSCVGVPGAAPYGSAKSGLLGLTRTLSTEWAPHGVRVNGIGPGYFRTAMTDVFYQDAQWQKQMLSKIPQARFGELSDLAGAVVFLCSPAARYITGQVLYVDGGYLAAI